MTHRRPTVLIVCDGWGVGATDPAQVAAQGNAVAMARTPVRDELVRSCPWGLLRTSGEAVGLPAGQMGNSEVGHLNLGAGRIVRQEVTRIGAAIRDGSFFRIPALLELGAELKRSRGALHLVGLCSDGGVHSEISHLWALLDWAEREGLPVRVHAVTDGRDASPTSGIRWIRELEARAGRQAQRARQGDGNAGAGARAEEGGGAGTGEGGGNTGNAPLLRIATVSGRYWAMDRDRRWERTELAWRAIARGEGIRTESASEHVAQSYAAGTTDEFLRPAVVGRGDAGAEGTDPAPPYDGIRHADAVLFFNFRADRARQLVSALMDDDFPHANPSNAGSPRGPCRRLVAMTRYEDDFPHPVLFPPRTLDNVLGEVLAGAGRTQLRMAETEKYPHVTYFFNGGVEEPFPGEDRHLIPSPGVATYDRKPEMSAPELTEALLARIAEARHDFILVNYANADMVGHTGEIPAAVRAVETVDACVGRVLEAVRARGGTALVTADHGNAERMLCEDGSPFTAHTTGPVRLILAAGGGLAPGTRRVRDGILADVAPTVLQAMGLPQPEEMTGRGLVE